MSLACSGRQARQWERRRPWSATSFASVRHAAPRHSKGTDEVFDNDAREQHDTEPVKHAATLRPMRDAIASAFRSSEAELTFTRIIHELQASTCRTKQLHDQGQPYYSPEMGWSVSNVGTAGGAPL